jgi:aldose sugar dehydrogenase
VFAAVALAVAVACAPAAAPPPSISSEPTREATAQRGREPTPTPRPPPTPEPRTNNRPTPVAIIPSDIRETQFLDDVQLPAGLTFAPDGRLFFNEVSRGFVRIADADGTLRREPFVTLKIARRTEQGALGLALDPHFSTNRYVYVFYSHSDKSDGEPEENRVVRFTERDGVGVDRTLIARDLPIGICCHNGGKIAFGPDGKLYVTLGDQNSTERAQNMNRLNGKVLRVNPDGSIPDDNPFPGSPIYALGFRNPWGLAFHPLSGVPYLTENGEEGHDEINRIVAGGNYGTPVVDGVANDPRFVDPVWESGLGRLAPTGGVFYTGDAMPEFLNDFFFCAFNTGDLSRMRFGGPNFDRVIEHDVIGKGCYLDVANGPDGALYFASLTSIQRLGR